MGYIHSVGAVMVANDIARRRNLVKLGKLQEEFFTVVADEVYNDGQTYDECVARYGSWEAYLEALRGDIKTMNAAQISRELKLWKEDISFGRKK